MAKQKLSKVIKARKKTAQKRSRSMQSNSKKKGNNLSLYSNLAHKRRTKKDLEAKKHAEYLASLPKNPILRFFCRLHPKRVLRYWFSKKGLFMFLKLTGVFILICAIGIFSIFAYFRSELDQIKPGAISRRVQSTTNRFYDRHGTLLWEDRGEGNYRIIVEGHEISEYMRQAIIALEDREFFYHRGISIPGIIRATINNLRGRPVQGGSTLTQQLIKQIYFPDEAMDRTITGVSRKLKEMILAIEIERMYSKEQILTLYLNESPFGGRRNGVESAARTYFGISAAELNLAQAALLAAIPNNPAVLNPYNVAGHAALIDRQHKTLNDMVTVGFITREQADEAKAIDILDTILPEQGQFENIRAPHFVLEAQKELEAYFGVRRVRAGGLRVITTLDYEIQQVAERAVQQGISNFHTSGADNIAFTSIDVQTSQVRAMVGSVDFHRPGFGSHNAAVAPLEPGSSIKSTVGFAPLFNLRTGHAWGAGSILKDEDINAIYCRGSFGPCSIHNATRQTFGNISIRRSLAGSLNRPAVKATYIVGLQEALRINRELGNHHYCTDNPYVGLSAAIGGGCGVLLVEHTNAHTSLARNGVYKSYTYILEVTDTANNTVIKRWEDTPGRQVIDPQAAYMVTDILADRQARQFIFGWNAQGFVIPGVWTATKTGTTDTGHGQAKDSWMMSYSTVLATGVWAGMHDGSALRTGNHSVVASTTAYFMYHVHHHVLGPRGDWSADARIPRPNGIQTLTVNGITDLWPSWATRNNLGGGTRETAVFNSATRRRAIDCTPEHLRVEVEFTRLVDPVTGTEIFFGLDDWDHENYDDLSACVVLDPPTITGVSVSPSSITITASPGAPNRPLAAATISLTDGTPVGSAAFTGSTAIISHSLPPGVHTIRIRIVDSANQDNTHTQVISV